MPPGALTIGSPIGGMGNGLYAGPGLVKLPSGATVPLSAYQMFGDQANTASALSNGDVVSYNNGGQSINNPLSGSQWSLGKYNPQGTWVPDTNSSNASAWAQSLGLNMSNWTNPNTANPSSGAPWANPSPMMPTTAPMIPMGAGGMNNRGALGAGITPQTGAQPMGTFSPGLGGVMPGGLTPRGAGSGDLNGTMAGIPGMPTPQAGMPPPQNLYGTLGGGSMPAPVGGYWNQVAQQMAGPMFGPYGASSLMGQSNPIQAPQPSPLLQPPTPPKTPGAGLGYNPTQIPQLGSIGALSGLSSLPFGNQAPPQTLGPYGRYMRF